MVRGDVTENCGWKDCSPGEMVAIQDVLRSVKAEPYEPLAVGFEALAFAVHLLPVAGVDHDACESNRQQHQGRGFRNWCDKKGKVYVVKYLLLSIRINNNERGVHEGIGVDSFKEDRTTVRTSWPEE